MAIRRVDTGNSFLNFFLLLGESTGGVVTPGKPSCLDSDSDDCVILEVSKPRHLITESSLSSHRPASTTQQQHGRNFWRPERREQQQQEQQVRRSNRTPQLSEASSDEEEEATSSDSSTSAEDSSDGGVGEEGEPVKEMRQLPDSESMRLQQQQGSPSPVMLPTLSIFSSSSSSSSSSEEEEPQREAAVCSPPPMLEPAVALSPPPLLSFINRKARQESPPAIRRRADESSAVECRRVECGSQTVESIFPAVSSRPFVSPSSPSCLSELGGQGSFEPSSVACVPGSTTPPRLFGFGSEPCKLNRGRPRKNPPMLKPAVGANEEEGASSANESDSVAAPTVPKVKKLRRKRDKLSVLYKVAKHWQPRKPVKKDGCDDEVEMEGEECVESGSSRPHTAAESLSDFFPDREQDEENRLRASSRAEFGDRSGGEELVEKDEIESKAENDAENDRHYDSEREQFRMVKRKNKVRHRRPGGLSKGKNVKALHHKKRRRRRHADVTEKGEEEEEREAESRTNDRMSEKKRRLKKKLKRKEEEEKKKQARSRKHCRCDKKEDGGEDDSTRHKSHGLKQIDEKRQKRRRKATGCFECCADSSTMKSHRKKGESSRKKSLNIVKETSEESGEEDFRAEAEETAKTKKEERHLPAPGTGRSELETKEEIIRTIFTSKTNSKNYFNPADYESALLFPKHFCNLRPDRFWKRSKATSVVSLPEPVPESLLPEATMPVVPVEVVGMVPAGGAVTTAAVFTTKASLKEMPPGSNQAFATTAGAAVPSSQVQQMLRVLKDASRSSSGRRRKEAARRAQAEEAQLKEAAETAYEVRVLKLKIFKLTCF